VGTGVELSVKQICDLVLTTLDKPASLVVTVPDRPGHDRRYLLDWSKIKRELGWEPKIPVEDGIRDTIRWYADNRAWWEPLRDRAPVVESGWNAVGKPA
jgi:dTDP-glucose 4,6-dehydratase